MWQHRPSHLSPHCYDRDLSHFPPTQWAKHFQLYTVGQIVFPFYSELNTFSTSLWSTHYQHIHNGPFAQQKSGTTMFHPTLIKKKRKFSSYMRKFRMEQLQSHIWLTASSYMLKYLRISSYIRKPFIKCDFATSPFCIYLHMRTIFFSFLSV